MLYWWWGKGVVLFSCGLMCMLWFCFFLNSFSRYLVQCVVGTYLDIGCDMEAH